MVSVFKNISYPLLWADESMTAMGCERVLQYGYPKAHDGKNVVNDMFCNTPKLGVNEKDDAFIGGANWGQYYIGTIGYMLANTSDDLYSKTGLFRAFFATLGLSGLFIFAWCMSLFFAKGSSRYLFLCAFLLAELISVSLILHLKEVRYYSPTLLFSSLIIVLYVLHRFRKPIHKVIFTVTLTVLLWIMFNMFSPLYFIFITTIGLSEIVVAAFQYRKVHNVKNVILFCLPVLLSLLISLIAVYPLMEYFKTFEMKQMLDKFYGFNSAMYWWHFSVVLRYFRNFELLWLMLVLRIWVLAGFKKIATLNSSVFKVSNFLTLLFVVFIFSVPNVDSPMFTRYLIYMQPVIAVIAIFDFTLLYSIYKGSLKSPSLIALVSISICLSGYTFFQNLPYMEGHISEMTHIYKGPLDYTIPYIKSNFPRTDTLTIATNYEETSFMYYLKSKVIEGFVGNNMPEDTLFSPSIISYRKHITSFDVFEKFLLKTPYQLIVFPCKDIPVNNIPELNFESDRFNHYFKSLPPENDNDATTLGIKQSILPPSLKNGG